MNRRSVVRGSAMVLAIIVIAVLGAAATVITATVRAGIRHRNQATERHQLHAAVDAAVLRHRTALEENKTPPPLQGRYGTARYVITDISLPETAERRLAVTVSAEDTTLRTEVRLLPAQNGNTWRIAGWDEHPTSLAPSSSMPDQSAAPTPTLRIRSVTPSTED